jgi:hypothetical protein
MQIFGIYFRVVRWANDHSSQQARRIDAGNSDNNEQRRNTGISPLRNGR